jgi:hypothetical protein
MLTEETKTDKIEVLEDGRIQVREATIIYRDGVEISRTYHRTVLDPGMPHNREIVDERLEAIKAVVWTDEVVAKRVEKVKDEVARRES